MDYIGVMPTAIPPRSVRVRGVEALPLVGERVMLCDPDDSEPGAYPGTVYEVTAVTHGAQSGDEGFEARRTYRSVNTLIHLRRWEGVEGAALMQIANAGRDAPATT
jgi:hypothetical protein